VTDASIIGSHAGQLFLMLRAGQHPMREIKAAVHKFENSGIKITGAIMNDVPIDTGTGRNYYHYDYT
jgi:tyrosine-protein kinase Etk/Wzc